MCIVCEAPSREAMFEHVVIVLIIIPLGMLLFGRFGSEVFCLFVCLPYLAWERVWKCTPFSFHLSEWIHHFEKHQQEQVRSRENVKGEYQYYQ